MERINDSQFSLRMFRKFSELQVTILFASDDIFLKLQDTFFLNSYVEKKKEGTRNFYLKQIVNSTFFYCNLLFS